MEQLLGSEFARVFEDAGKALARVPVSNLYKRSISCYNCFENVILVRGLHNRYSCRNKGLII